jgi:hypothetical protein
VVQAELALVLAAAGVEVVEPAAQLMAKTLMQETTIALETAVLVRHQQYLILLLQRL